MSIHNLFSVLRSTKLGAFFIAAFVTMFLVLGMTPAQASTPSTPADYIAHVVDNMKHSVTHVYRDPNLTTNAAISSYTVNNLDPIIVASGHPMYVVDLDPAQLGQTDVDTAGSLFASAYGQPGVFFVYVGFKLDTVHFNGLSPKIEAAANTVYTNVTATPTDVFTSLKSFISDMDSPAVVAQINDGSGFYERWIGNTSAVAQVPTQVVQAPQTQVVPAPPTTSAPITSAQNAYPKAPSGAPAWLGILALLLIPSLPSLVVALWLTLRYKVRKRRRLAAQLEAQRVANIGKANHVPVWHPEQSTPEWQLPPVQSNTPAPAAPSDPTVAGSVDTVVVQTPTVEELHVAFNAPSAEAPVVPTIEQSPTPVVEEAPQQDNNEAV